MKPTPQISPSENASRNFPLTDYSFQATVEAPPTSVANLPTTDSRPFHKLSSEFLCTEIIRDHIAELVLFALITVLSAWPIASTIIAITRLVRNY